MKPTIFLISLYFLFLAVFPCNCGEVVADAHKNMETTAVHQGDCQHGHNTTSDSDCTPFCACSGAHSPSFITTNDTPLFKTTASVKKILICDDDEFSSYFGSLWRPPQNKI